MAGPRLLPLNSCALLIAATALSGCGGREAEGETPVAEAEVSTELPESVVSDQRLDAAANAAAQVASSPPAQVVVVPVPGSPGGNQGAATGGQSAPATGQSGPATAQPAPPQQAETSSR